MRFFQKVKDGGPDSPVDAYVLIEIKSLFSIMLLHFPKGRTREAYHSHAFNAITIWLKGKVREHLLGDDGAGLLYTAPSIKRTPTWLMHKIEPIEDAWALTFRGPWRDKWEEYRENNPKGSRFVILTHGRKEVK